MSTTEPITEEWLRECGFRWDQRERCPSKHWLLWIAEACIDPVEKKMFASQDDLGIELAKNTTGDWWFCWLRADYAGKYTRFLHVRHLQKQYEVTEIIEALTGRVWEPKNVVYGSLRSPDVAKRLKDEDERLDKRLAADWGKRVELEMNLDPGKREPVNP